MDNLDISKIYIPNTQEDGIIKYKNFIFFYDSDRKIINDVRDLVDISKFAIAINRTKKIVTIYGWDDNINNYSIPIVSFPCTTNKTKTELGIHFISDKYRWKDLYGGHFGQYAMRFAEHQLLHSVLYSNPDINALEIKSYNGINNDTQSSGCIRLRSGDAYWMYNHIDNGTLVYVYDGVSTNPYGREVLEELDYSYTFDPTDPLIE